MPFSQTVKYNETDPLDAIFSALADPTRRAILEVLSRGETTVNEVAKPFDLSLPTVSKHLKVLEHAGLISRGRQAQWRPCRIETEALKRVAAWSAHYEGLWVERLTTLQSLLKDPKP